MSTDLPAEPYAEKDAVTEDPAQRGSSRSQRWAPAALVVVVLGLGFPALDSYNVTWDEALGDFFFGERYLSFFTSFDPIYLDFESQPYPPNRVPDLSVSPFKIRPWEYYPFANTLAAATSTVLSRGFGWLDPFDGFHALNVLLAGLLAAVFYRFFEVREGWLMALVAVALLLSGPRVVCHMMANIKDFPLMVLYSLTALAFFVAYERGSTRGLLGAGVLLGATLATKANALFFPAIPGLLLVLGGIPESWKGRGRRLVAALFAAGLTSVAVMVALWPYLWPDPIGRYREHLLYIGLREGYTRAESVAPALQAIFLTTSPVFLLFFAIGLVPTIRRALRRDRLALFLLIWIAVVMGRFLLPQAVNFDGVRHFLELFPAMAAVAGLGVSWLGSHINGIAQASRHSVSKSATPWVSVALLAVILLPAGWTLARVHPFEIAYWNLFAGGPARAYARGLPQAGDYWGMSYRLGIEWLNENALPDAALAVPVVEHAVRLVAPTRLRSDLLLLPVTRPYTPQIAPDRLQKTRAMARERPVYVMFVVRQDWMNELMLDCLRNLEPEVAWELEGAPVLVIYRYVPPGA